jgi:hypothetical protein
VVVENSMRRTLAWLQMAVLILLGACASHHSTAVRKPDSSSTLTELICHKANEAQEPISFQEFAISTGVSTDALEMQARQIIQALESIGQEITDRRGFENVDFFYEMEDLAHKRDETEWYKWLSRHDQVEPAVKAVFAKSPSLVSAVEDRGTCHVMIRSYPRQGLYGLTIRFTAGMVHRLMPHGRDLWIGECDGTNVAVDYDGICCGSSAITGRLVLGRKKADSPKYGIDGSEMNFVFK